MKKEEKKKDRYLSNEIKLPKISDGKKINKTLSKENKSIRNNMTTNNSLNFENKLNIKGKNNKNVKNRIKLKKNNKNNLKIIASLPDINERKYTIEKLEEYKKKRKERLKREKKEEEKGLKIYEQVLKEYEEKKEQKLKRVNSEIDSKNENINKLPRIEISEKKAKIILEEGGMFDAYKYLLEQLCKNGLPSGNIFEYSSYIIKNYEKKWKEKKYKIKNERFEEYWKEKKEFIEKNKDSKDKEIIKGINKSLEEREINKIIKSLDRSRSSRHHHNFNKFLKNKSDKNLNKINKMPKISVEQKNGEENNKNKRDSMISNNRNSIISNKRNSIISNKNKKENDKSIISTNILNNNKLIYPLKKKAKKEN